MDYSATKEAEIAKLLILLRQETQKSIEEATGIRTTNLSAWLRGKPQSISLARVSLLLNHLGVFQMKLRKDRLHEWCVPVEDPSALSRLLHLLGEHDFSRASLYTALLREYDVLDTHILIIDSFSPSPVIRIQEDQTIYNGHFVCELKTGQQLTVRNNLFEIPGETVLEFRRNLLKQADIQEFAITPEFKQIDYDINEKKFRAIENKHRDAYSELSTRLSKSEKNILALPLLRLISTGMPIEQIANAIDAITINDK